MKRSLLVALLALTMAFCWTAVVSAEEAAKTDAPAKAESAVAPKAPEKAAETAAAPKAETAKASETPSLPTADSVLALVKEKLKDVKDLSEDLKATVTGPKGPINMSGTLKAISPDMSRIELTAKEKGEDGKETVVSSMKIITNKMMMFQEVFGDFTKGVTNVLKTDLTEIEKIQKEMADQGLGAAPTKAPPRDFVNYLQSQKDAGSTFKVIMVERDLVTLEVLAKGGPARQEVVVSTADGLVQGIKIFNGDKVMMEFRMSNIKINNKLKADEFAYTPPEGAQVVDMAQEMRKMIQAQQMQQRSAAPKPAPAESSAKPQ